MMRSLQSFFFLLAMVWTTQAFVPAVAPRPNSNVALDMERRDVLEKAAAAVLGGAWLWATHADPAQAKAASTFFFDENIENVKEASQMPTGGKVDLNSAFVGEYKYFPGMFPHAAGMIASHGPYKDVKDIYKIPKLTENDKKLFQKYDKYFTVNPPGRGFSERINARVST
ncbi:hypothetical protein ACA910_010195 [Epithemia clementina (nom. ined.)]